MIEIGFWRRYESPDEDSDDLRPWPETCSRTSAEWDALVAYLELGYVETMELGYSECRLCGLFGLEMGCLSLTDGKFVWPEGLAHYVRDHHVELPEAFENHALGGLAELKANWERFKYSSDTRTPVLEWSVEKNSAIRACAETEAWVLEHSLWGGNNAAHPSKRCWCWQ